MCSLPCTVCMYVLVCDFPRFRPSFRELQGGGSDRVGCGDVFLPVRAVHGAESLRPPAPARAQTEAQHEGGESQAPGEYDHHPVALSEGVLPC